MVSSADRHQHLGALIAEQVQAQPQAVCLVEQGQSYSRADLWGSACRYAEHLRAQQITKSGTIALVVLDTRTGLEVLIAAWSLGAAVLFLDPRQSIEEIQTSGEHANVQSIITNSPSHSRRGGFHLLPRADRLRATALELAFDDEDGAQDALLLSSSGTTGLPRFRRRSHRQLIDDWEATSKLLRRPRFKHELSAGSLAFGAFVSLCLKSLIHGTPLTVLPLMFRTAELDQALSHPDIEFASLPPVLIRDLLSFHGHLTLTDDDLEARPPVVRYPHLKRLVSVGGPLSPQDLRLAYRCLTPHVRNVYSLSGVGAVSFLEGLEIETHFGSVGRVLDEIEVTIEDLPDSDSSSLALEPQNPKLGRIVAKALWKPDALRIDTGDLGWLSPDGYLYVAARGSQFACRNAINVNLADLEKDVRRLSFVRDCLAFGLPTHDGSNDQIFLAVESHSTTEEVTQALAQSLSRQRRPDWLYLRPALQRNAGSKIILHRLKGLALDPEGSGFVRLR